MESLLREPAGAPEGAVVLNHGRGADETDLFGLLELVDPERRLLGVSTGAPFTAADVAERSTFPTPPGGRHWYAPLRVGRPEPETFGRSYRALSELVDGLLADRGIGWDRTVIGGFSMGAVMAYAVALGEGRPSPAGIAALSGFLPVVQGWRPKLAGREGLPAFVHHGLNDQVIEIGFGREAVQRLREAGLDVRFFEGDAGHWVPPELLDELSGFVAETLSL